MSDDYYVYELSKPDGTAFYFGKGRGNRIDDHERDARNGIQCTHELTVEQLGEDNVFEVPV